MIHLTHLELHKFLSHLDTVIDFTSYQGLTLIEGKTTDGHYSSNGSGKSTILEGIVYALTGNTLRGVGVNDVVNRNYKKDTHVLLRFDINDDSYEIHRYRKDTEHGDDIVFIKNGENISKRVNKETQQLIDDTLGISFKVLTSTVLLGEGLSSRFTQLSDPEKKSLIESTLNLSYDMNTLRATANNTLSQLKLDVSNLEGSVSALKQFSDFDTEAISSEIKRLDEDYQNKIKSLGDKNNDINSSSSRVDQLVDRVNLIKSSIDKIDYLRNNLAILDSQNTQLITELTEAEKCDNPRCTVCHQELKDEASHKAFRKNYQERINAVTSQMSEYHNQLASLPDRDILSQKFDLFNSELSDLRETISQMSHESQQIQSEAYTIKSELDKLKYQMKQYNEVNTDIESTEVELTNKISQLERYDYFYKLFSPTGIIVNILSEAVDYINGRLSTYSEVLLDKKYHINFVKGKLSLVDESGSSYQSLSNGEKKRLDISIQFALHDYVTIYCGMNINCCFIDEILDTLDDIGVDNIFDVLRLKIDYCNLDSIYVITHNDSLKGKFDRVITVLKNEKGDSTIV